MLNQAPLVMTHSPTLFVFQTVQPPIASAISFKANIPATFICSKTVKTKNYYFPLTDTLDNKSHADVLNLKYKEAQYGELPCVYENPLIDNALLKVHTQVEENTALKLLPVAPIGLYQTFLKLVQDYKGRNCYDNSQRNYNHDNPYFFNQELIAKDSMPNRLIQSYIFKVADNDLKIEEKETRLVLTLDLIEVDTSLGKMGVGLISPYMIGSFLTSFLTRNIIPFGNLRFSCGVTYTKSFRFSANRSRPSKQNTQIVIVIDLPSYLLSNYDVIEHIKKRFNYCSQLHNFKIVAKTFRLTKIVPKAYWFIEANKEIRNFLVRNPQSDSLVATFELNKLFQQRMQNIKDHKFLNDKYIPLVTGFALLSNILTQPKSPYESKGGIMNYAWGEFLIKPTYLQYGHYSPQYLYNLKTDNDQGVYYWEQDN